MKPFFASMFMYCIFTLLMCMIITFELYSQNQNTDYPTDDPTIICPDDIVDFADANSCSAYVNIPLPEINSTCGDYTVWNNYNLSPDASDIYPVGSIEIMFFVSDSCGEAECNMTITVFDTIPPVITCPSDVVFSTCPDSCWAFVTLPSATGSDNCAIDSIWNNYTSSNNGFAHYPVGVTEVTWYAVDVYGNIDSCMTNVCVVDDTPPEIMCPENIAVYTGDDSTYTFVNVPIPLVSDNCLVDQTINNFNLTTNASDLYPTGTTDVMWYTQDIYGNADSCLMQVEVINNLGFEDNESVSFSIYPNPSNGDFTVHLDKISVQEITLEVIDITGKVILSDNVQVEPLSEFNSIQVSNLQEGVYLISVRGESLYCVKKVVVL